MSGTKGLLYHLGGVPLLDVPLPRSGGTVWFVDGTHGLDGNTGKSLSGAKKTIQDALDEVAEGDTVLVLPKEMAITDTDPGSYAETLIVSKANISIIGVSRGRTQGGLPQIKIGAGSTALLTVRGPGCLIANLGFNGIDSTGGGILLDDNGSTKNAFGTTITGCHFKNCKKSSTSSALGGAITMDGCPWQIRIQGNTFYKNVGGVVGLPTHADGQDIVIEDNTFSGTAATVDSYIYIVAGGGGFDGIVVRRNVFASAIPALSNGVVVRYMDLTGCTGILAENYFGCTDTATGFGAAKATAKVPTTVGIANNYSDGGLIVRQA